MKECKKVWDMVQAFNICAWLCCSHEPQPGKYSFTLLVPTLYYIDEILITYQSFDHMFRARYEDAKFFYEMDTRKRFSEFRSQLKGILFHVIFSSSSGYFYFLHVLLNEQSNHFFSILHFMWLKVGTKESFLFTYLVL